jgi:hypothetical protein
MHVRVVLVFLIPFMIVGCGGGDKHLPSSNPPEYDPKKVYSTPAQPSLAQSAMPLNKPLPPRKAVPDPCERPLKKRPDPDVPATGCNAVSGREERPIVGEGGAGGGVGGGSGGGGGGRGERPARPTGEHPSYVLEFRSMIMSSDPDGDPGQSQASAVIPLVASGEVSPSGEMKYIGQGMIAYQTGPLPQIGNPVRRSFEGKARFPCTCCRPSFTWRGRRVGRMHPKEVLQRSNCSTASSGARKKPPRAAYRLTSTTNAFPISPNPIPFGLLTTSAAAKR